MLKPQPVWNMATADIDSVRAWHGLLCYVLEDMNRLQGVVAASLTLLPERPQVVQPGHGGIDRTLPMNKTAKMRDKYWAGAGSTKGLDVHQIFPYACPSKVASQIPASNC